MSYPLHAEVAFRELLFGVRERSGGEHHPRIIDYHAEGAGAVTDEVPWCAGFANFCLKQAAIQGTQRHPYPGLAQSFLFWGLEVTDVELPPLGCIAVLSRGPRAERMRTIDGQPEKGHVGFFIGHAGNNVLLIGGNQGDSVSVRAYQTTRVISYRVPSASDRMV